MQRVEVPATGNAASGATGTLTPEISIPLTGVQATSAPGILYPQPEEGIITLPLGEVPTLCSASIGTVVTSLEAPDDPLLQLSASARDRLLLTPHIAGMTRGAMHRMLTGAIENILRAASGETPEHVVNGIHNLRAVGSV